MYINKKRSTFLITILALSLLLSGCLISTKTHPTLITDDYNDLRIDKVNNYKIEVEFNPEKKIYTGKQVITYINNTGNILDEIFIHLYPNAFKSEDTAPFLYDDLNTKYKAEFQPGFIDLNKVKVDKKRVNYDIQSSGDTILKLKLNSPLKPEKKV